jgi:hypothetical protein
MSSGRWKSTGSSQSISLYAQLRKQQSNRRAREGDHSDSIMS